MFCQTIQEQVQILLATCFKFKTIKRSRSASLHRSYWTQRLVTSRTKGLTYNALLQLPSIFVMLVHKKDPFHNSFFESSELIFKQVLEQYTRKVCFSLHDVKNQYWKIYFEYICYNSTVLQICFDFQSFSLDQKNLHLKMLKLCPGWQNLIREKKPLLTCTQLLWII